MIHVHYFLTRKPSLDDGEFHRYWREKHGPLAMRTRQMRAYVQSHRIPFAGTSSPYDGVAEIFVDNLDALAELRESREFREGAKADEPNFIDLARVEYMATRDHVIVDGPIGAGLVKGIWQIKRADGIRLRDFRDYWLNTHGPLGSKLPGLRRYVQCHLIDEAYRYSEPRYDGVAQMWFDSADSLQAAFESTEGKELQADAKKFVVWSGMGYFVAQEHVVIAPR